MLKSAFPKFTARFLESCPALWLCALLVAFTAAPAAMSQDFSLTATPFDPVAISPGGNAASNITLTAGTAVSVVMSCTITSQTVGTPPACQISPTTVSVPGGAVATITSSGDTTPGLYQITMTGTGPSTTHFAQQNVTVLAVSPQFTITVDTAVAPSSVPAGNGAQGIININPINGYVSPTGGNGQTGVTLSCATVTPLVTIPPYCSFDPPNPTVNGVVTQSTITINTWGNQTASHQPNRPFYVFWLTIPVLGMTLVGASTGRRRARKGWLFLAIFVITASLLLLPACGNNSSSSTTNPDGVTPNNSYSFTILGVDADGNISSNATGTSVGPTVSLTVTSPVSK